LHPNVTHPPEEFPVFDAKSILEQIVKGAQAQSAAPAGGGGGLGDILGQVLKGAGGAGGASAGGGLGDILSQLQAKLGQAGAGGAAAAPADKGQASGGLGDILGQLQAKLGQGTGGMGGLADVLGQVLSQATSGVKEGAGRLDSATGASEALGKATGQSPADILAKLQELTKQNPMAAGTAMGGLGGLVLGTHAGRAVAGHAVKLGALALIGGLAYKAFENYQAGKPLINVHTEPEAAPAGSGFESAAVTHDAAALYIRAMVAAAAADGRIDDDEQTKIIGSLKQAGLDAEAEEFLANELNNPASVEDLAAAASTPEQAVQVYTAARIAINPDSPAEKQFLAALASALGIDGKLAQHIDATTRAAGA
jgi:uncharacterized membrane protein YebE (DUF533 family)